MTSGVIVSHRPAPETDKGEVSEIKTKVLLTLPGSVCSGVLSEMIADFHSIIVLPCYPVPATAV